MMFEKLIFFYVYQELVMDSMIQILMTTNNWNNLPINVQDLIKTNGFVKFPTIHSELPDYTPGLSNEQDELDKLNNNLPAYTPDDKDYLDELDKSIKYKYMPDYTPNLSDELDKSNNNLPAYTPDLFNEQEEKCPEYEDIYKLIDIDKPIQSVQQKNQRIKYRWIVPLDLLKYQRINIDVKYNSKTKYYEIKNRTELAPFFRCKPSEIPRRLAQKNDIFPNTYDGDILFIVDTHFTANIMEYRNNMWI
jgi:hypothetical protein